MAVPGVLQAFGNVRLFAVVIDTAPPAERVANWLKESPFTEAVLVMLIEPVPDVVTDPLVVAK